MLTRTYHSIFDPSEFAVTNGFGLSQRRLNNASARRQHLNRVMNDRRPKDEHKGLGCRHSPGKLFARMVNLPLPSSATDKISTDLQIEQRSQFNLAWAQYELIRLSRVHPHESHDTMRLSESRHGLAETTDLIFVLEAG